LMACHNRQLVFNHEQRLENQYHARDKVMFAACCLGLVRIIRLLVLDYHAPVSSVPLSAKPQEGVRHRVESANRRKSSSHSIQRLPMAMSTRFGNFLDSVRALMSLMSATIPWRV
jgi:hypothetical protein